MVRRLLRAVINPKTPDLMNRTKLRHTLKCLGLTLGLSSFIVSVPPLQADEKSGGSNTGTSTSAPDSATSGAAPTGTPNSARPINSDGTPADANNLGTVSPANKGEPGLRNQANSQELDPKITSGWVKGTTIPKDYHTLLVELPLIEQENVGMRYREGSVFYINQEDWKIIRVAELDPGTQVTPPETVFVEGYVVPDPLRKEFMEMPTPEAGTVVRVYNDTAYYMDSEDRIVRTEKLASR